MNIARKEKKVIVMTGDLGYSFVEEFQKELPKQFLNAGVAEQNIISMAVGMSLAGMKPYCYSGAVFITHRPLEQIRNACYNDANVKIIGTGASQFLGFSHNFASNESEINILDKFPNITCHTGTNEKQLEKVLREENQREGMSYVRL